MESRKECTNCIHKCMEAVAYNSIYCKANREYDNKDHIKTKEKKNR